MRGYLNVKYISTYTIFALLCWIRFAILFFFFISRFLVSALV